MNKVKLGELLTVKHGYAFKSENYVEKSEFALVTLANISATNNFQFTPEKTTYYAADFPKDFILKTDDLIMPLTEQVIGLFGNTAFVPDMDDISFVLNQRVGKITPIEGRADKYYLHYLLATNLVKDQLEYRASGTRQRNISPSDIYDVEVYIPDIETQRKIGETLYKLEKKINTNNKINDNLSNQISKLYDYWFTQFDFPNLDGNPYRQSGGKFYTLPSGQKLPNGWKVSTVNSCIEKISTGLNPRDNFELGHGHIQYVTVKNLTSSGAIDFRNADTIDEAARAIVHKRSDISIGDVLYASIAPLGRAHLILKEPETWDINESVFSIRSKNDMISPEFLYCYLKSDYFVRKSTNSSTGSIFKGIRINTILDSRIVLPEKKVIDDFSKQVSPLLKMSDTIQTENEKLSSLREWLLPLLMNGQATINN